MYPSWGIIWHGYCAKNPDGQFGFNTNTQKDCCIALKKSGRSISAQDKKNCGHHWSSENSHNNGYNTQSTMVGGDGKQMYCGTLGPPHRKKCCQDMIHRHMNNTIIMNDNNKFACVDVLYELASRDGEDPKKKIDLFDYMMQQIMRGNSVSTAGTETTADVLPLTARAKTQGLTGNKNV